MKCTHIALQVRDPSASIAFYQRYCGMKAVHQRPNSSGTGTVTWLGWGEDPPRFVIVLIEGAYDQNAPPEWQHIGMAVDSRAEVDAAYARAVADGRGGLWPPVEGGLIVGYYCGVADPDGNMVEFSFGQRIG